MYEGVYASLSLSLCVYVCVQVWTVGKANSGRVVVRREMVADTTVVRMKRSSESGGAEDVVFVSV